MALLVLAVVVGLVAARLRRPLGAHLPRVQFEWVPLLGVGAVVNLGAYLLDGTAATLALAASLVLLLGFVGVNPHVTGVAVIGAGLLLNLVAVVLNDGMPVRGGALVAAGVVEEAELATTTFSGPRHLETSADTLAVLGDVLPVPALGEVMSFGDLIIVFGAADAVRELARRRRRHWSADERSAYLATSAPARLPVEAAATVAPTPRPATPVEPEVIELDEPPGRLRFPRRPLVAATRSS